MGLNKLFRHFICSETNYIFSLSPSLEGGVNFCCRSTCRGDPYPSFPGHIRMGGVGGLHGLWMPRNGEGALVSDGF